jgi:hypothetical protein
MVSCEIENLLHWWLDGGKLKDFEGDDSLLNHCQEQGGAPAISNPLDKDKNQDMRVYATPRATTGSAMQYGLQPKKHYLRRFCFPYSGGGL